jgi:hypothetical protein
VNEHESQTQRLWSFADGMIGAEDSIKDFRVEATDGEVGHVAWASYAPGESYLVVSVSHHLQHRHHIVPAALVEKVGTPERRVWLRLSRSEVEQAPEHHDPPAPLEPSAMDAIRSTWATFAIRG